MYDSDQKHYTLHMKQSFPNQTLATGETQVGAPLPLHIPVVVGLLDPTSGQELLPSTLLELKDYEASFILPYDGTMPPIASVLRGFSAPVQLGMPRSDSELAFLARYDTDPFVRWDSGEG